jgi:hypothetical protein
MRLDAFRVLSVALIAGLMFVTFDLSNKNAQANWQEHEVIEAQKSELAANIRQEHERKLFLKQAMAQGKPQRSRTDCAESLQAIQNKRLQLFKEIQAKEFQADPQGRLSFLVCEKNMTWLDGMYAALPLEYDYGPEKPCQPGEERLYSMFGCPLEMIQQLPGPF